MEKNSGYLVISLDFELFWGMSDKYTLAEYGENILGVRTALPRILDTFTAYGIHATWATVGMLMARNKEELLSLLPPMAERPVYEDMRMSSYHYLETANIGSDESSDPYHFGSSLVQRILETPHQELGNHTFSHYYAVDGHDNADAILACDLQTHAHIAKTYGVETESIVFPRNQTSPQALSVCAQEGIRAYRGNEEHFLYRARKDSEQSFLVRGLRLLDHYINMSGHHTYALPKKTEDTPLNVASSRFFRPYLRALSFLEPLRLLRIKRAMTHAAKRGEVFHLWWHPHNFGINQTENFKNLTSVLEHFKQLQEKYGMQSASMKDISTVVNR